MEKTGRPRRLNDAFTDKRKLVRNYVLQKSFANWKVRGLGAPMGLHRKGKRCNKYAGREVARLSEAGKHGGGQTLGCSPGFFQIWGLRVGKPALRRLGCGGLGNLHYRGGIIRN